MHPLTPDLSDLTDADLQKKHADLISRLTQSYRYGNAAMVSQLQMLLEDYQAEIRRRQEKLMQEMSEKNDKFKNIIDIK
jgi:hypothetical protein